MITDNVSYEAFIEKITSSNDTLYKLMSLTQSKTSKDLSEFLGITEQAINNAKRGGKIPAQWILYILARTGSSVCELYNQPASAYTKNIKSKWYRTVPLINIEVLEKYCGNLLLSRLDEIIKNIAIEEYDTIQIQDSILDSNNHHIFASHAIDDCMSPTIKNKSLIFIDISKKTIYSGNIYMLSFHSGITLGRVYKLSSRYRVCFDNSDVPAFNFSEPCIIGRVFKAVNDI